MNEGTAGQESQVSSIFRGWEKHDWLYLIVVSHKPWSVWLVSTNLSLELTIVGTISVEDDQGHKLSLCRQ